MSIGFKEFNPFQALSIPFRDRYTPFEDHIQNARTDLIEQTGRQKSVGDLPCLAGDRAKIIAGPCKLIDLIKDHPRAIIIQS